MRIVLFLVIGFSIANSIVFLHVSAWLRRLVSGVSDKQFYLDAKSGRLSISGFRMAYLGRLFRCHACMGFWVGGALSVFCGGFVNRYILCDNELILVVLDAFLLSGFNFVLWVFLRGLGAEDL